MRKSIPFKQQALLGLLVSLVSIVGVCSFGMAQQQRQGSPLLKILDSDGDSYISQQEMSRAVQALKRLDADGDGRLSRDEYGPTRTAPIPEMKEEEVPSEQARSGPGQVEKSGGSARDKVRRRDTEFLEKFPEGASLPDTLQLYNTDRELVAANSVFQSDYTVVVAGCLTCPAYRSSYPEIEAAARDFSDKGVQFYFLFQTLTHPEYWGFVPASSIEERFLQVEHAKELLKTKIPWLTDPMDNQMKVHFGMTPNSQFVFDSDGKVVHRDSWGRGSSLRASLEKLVGKPEKTTTVAELNLPTFGYHGESEKEMLVKRVRVDGLAIPLKVESAGESPKLDELRTADFSQSKRYMKLRPEADRQLNTTGSGQLYLGFRPDPIHGVQWNNLAEPPRYKIIAGEGVDVSPITAASPNLKVESDGEPREFLVDIKNWKAETPITVQIQYVACHKEKGWCIATEQEYTVWLEHDRTSGKVAGRSHFPGTQSGSPNGRGKGKGKAGKNKGGKGTGPE